MYIEYSAEEYTDACYYLLKMKQNCLLDHYPNGYYDPDRLEKAKAIDIALSAIDRIDWKHGDDVPLISQDGYAINRFDLQRRCNNAIKELDEIRDFISCRNEDEYKNV